MDCGRRPGSAEPATFERSKLDWNEPTRRPHAACLECYRALVALRRRRSEISDPWLEHLGIEYDEDTQWIAMIRGSLRVCVQPGSRPVTVPIGGIPLLWWDEPTVDATASAVVLPGHSFAVLDADPVARIRTGRQ